MPSDQHNSTMAKNRDLIFSLLDVISAREVPFEAPLFIKCTLHGLTSTLLCVPIIFAHHEKCQFCGTHVMDSIFITEIVCNFHSGYFDGRGSFQTVVVCTAV